jgi:hypothetical protein
MTTIRNAGKAAPAVAVITALASLACCLPWGIGALLGSVGLGFAFERHRPWLIALSLIFLALGGYSLLHTSRSCRRLPKAFTFFFSLAVIVVMAITAFPDWIASIMVNLR